MTVTFSSIFNDLILLFSFLLAGYVIRELVKPIQWLYIPASVVAGVIALILGPQVLGLVTIPETFGSMAGVMITMVLTASVIGVDFDSSKATSYLAHLCIMVSMYGSGLLFLGRTRHRGQRGRSLGRARNRGEHFHRYDHVDHWRDVLLYRRNGHHPLRCQKRLGNTGFQRS